MAFVVSGGGGWCSKGGKDLVLETKKPAEAGFYAWCPGEDSNFHGRKATNT